MLVMVAATCLAIAAGALVLFIKIDGKVSHIERTVNSVRSTQVANTTLLTKTAGCELRAFNAILTDARLAFAGDTNANDYLKATTC